MTDNKTPECGDPFAPVILIALCITVVVLAWLVMGG